MKNPAQWVYLSAAILSEVIGTSALKAADGFARPLPSLTVLVAYASSFYLLSLTLRTVPIGITYAIWAGSGVALITIAGRVLYGQTLNWASASGIGLIIAGVAVIRLWGNSAAR